MGGATALLDALLLRHVVVGVRRMELSEGDTETFDGDDRRYDANPAPAVGYYGGWVFYCQAQFCTVPFARYG